MDLHQELLPIKVAEPPLQMAGVEAALQAVPDVLLNRLSKLGPLSPRRSVFHWEYARSTGFRRQQMIRQSGATWTSRAGTEVSPFVRQLRYRGVTSPQASWCESGRK